MADTIDTSGKPTFYTSVDEADTDPLYVIYAVWEDGGQQVRRAIARDVQANDVDIIIAALEARDARRS